MRSKEVGKSSLNHWKLVLTAFLPGPRRALHLFSLGSPSQHCVQKGQMEQIGNLVPQFYVAPGLSSCIPKEFLDS